MKKENLLRRLTATFFMLTGIFTAAFLFVALFALLMSAAHKAHAAATGPGTTVYKPNFWHGCTNWSNVWVASNGGTFSLGPQTNDQITFLNNGDSWMVSLTTTNNSTGTFSIFFGVDVDGNTNWTDTNHPAFIWPIPFSGSNTFIAWTNFSPLLLNNGRFIFPYMASNSCTTNYVKVNWAEESHYNMPVGF